MVRKPLTVLAACLLLASAAAAKRQTLHLVNGSRITGEVEKTADGYQVTLGANQVVTIPADQVASVEDVVTPRMEYEKRLAETDPDSFADHYRLGKWAFDRGEGYYPFALAEFKAALKIKPGDEAAALMLKQTQAKLAAPEDDGDGGEDGDTEEKDDGDKTKKPSKVMDMKDVNRIRLRELRKDDAVFIGFRNNVVNRFVESRRGRGDFSERGFERTFLGWPNARKARYMLDNLAESDFEMLDDIVIRSDPKFMREFQSLWPVLSKIVEGQDLRGNPKIPDLDLVKRGANRTRIQYTNFYLLSRYGKDGWKMIDRDQPDKSLLLQYGLPEKLAIKPHPARVNPVFTGPDDAKYKQVYQWIEKLSGPPHHGYTLSFRPPSDKKETPATRPADEAAPAATPVE